MTFEQIFPKTPRYAFKYTALLRIETDYKIEMQANQLIFGITLILN